MWVVIIAGLAPPPLFLSSSFSFLKAEGCGVVKMHHPHACNLLLLVACLLARSPHDARTHPSTEDLLQVVQAGPQVVQAGPQVIIGDDAISLQRDAFQPTMILNVVYAQPLVLFLLQHLVQQIVNSGDTLCGITGSSQRTTSGEYNGNSPNTNIHRQTLAAHTSDMYAEHAPEFSRHISGL
jgi:hypothetical protein